MKKISVIMVLLLLLSSAAGCSSPKTRGPQAEPAAKTTDKPKEIRGTISVSLGSRYMEEAAQRFEALHPGVKVEIREHEPQNGVDDVTYEKTLKRLDTELMSGNGADVLIVLPSAPFQKYASHHMFVNLDELMKSDPSYQASQYYTNIFAALKYQDGLYTLPIYYSYSLLGSDIEIKVNDRQWNWQEFAREVISAHNKNSEYVLPFSEEGLLWTIVSRDYSRFVNDEKKSASFNSREFISLLKLCKELTDQGCIRKEAVKPSSAAEPPYQTVLVCSLFDLAWTQTSREPVKYLYRYPSQIKGSNVFNTGTMVAINSASANQNTAWEFVKFLISKDMQSSPTLYSFPVNKAAYKQMAANQTDQFRQDKNISLSQEQRDTLMQKYARFSESITGDFNGYSCSDPRIPDLVTKEAQPFFAGDVTAEATAQRIQEKVDFYMKE